MSRLVLLTLIMMAIATSILSGPIVDYTTTVPPTTPVPPYLTQTPAYDSKVGPGNQAYDPGSTYGSGSSNYPDYPAAEQSPSYDYRGPAYSQRSNYGSYPRQPSQKYYSSHYDRQYPQADSSYGDTNSYYGSPSPSSYQRSSYYGNSYPTSHRVGSSAYGNSRPSYDQQASYDDYDSSYPDSSYGDAGGSDDYYSYPDSYGSYNSRQSNYDSYPSYDSRPSYTAPNYDSYYPSYGDTDRSPSPSYSSAYRPSYGHQQSYDVSPPHTYTSSGSTYDKKKSYTSPIAASPGYQGYSVGYGPSGGHTKVSAPSYDNYYNSDNYAAADDSSSYDDYKK